MSTVESVIDKLATASPGASAAPEAPAATPTAPVEEPKPVTPAVEPSPEGQPEPPVEVPTEPDTDTEPDPEAEGEIKPFADYKETFKEHPELRRAVGVTNAIDEQYGGYQNVREVLDRVPTVEDAESLVADSDTRKAFSETFRESPLDFAENLRASDDLAYRNFVSEMPRVLEETDPTLWTQQATAYTSRVLGNAYAIAQQTQDQELLTAVQVLARGLGLPLTGQAQPTRTNDPEKERLRAQLREREEADSVAAFRSFYDTTDNTIKENVLGDIERTLKVAVPNVSEAQFNRMVGEVYQQIQANLNAQPQFVSQLETYIGNARNGRMGIGDHKAIVDFVVKRARLVIPKATKTVTGEWNSQILRNHNSKITEKKAIADSSKDVGKGPQGSGSTAAPGPTAKGNRPVTTEDVFKRLESQMGR